MPVTTTGFPKILRAIPLRRYQFGDFAVTLLGEVESNDPQDYRLIVAFVKEGETQPRLYVTSERLPPGQRDRGGFRLRLLTRAIDEVMAVGDQWGDEELFTEQALQLGGQAMGLEGETPYRLQ